MLPIDWIFAPSQKKKNNSFSDFIVALANAPHESLFSTDLIHMLVDHFWERYYRAVIYRCFLPYLVYYVSVLWYLSLYGVSKDDEPKEADKV